MLADARLDRRAKHLAVITPGVPIFVCRNLLILADHATGANVPLESRRGQHTLGPTTSWAQLQEHFTRLASQKSGTTEATQS
jgi:hypothetical protein